MNNNRLNIILLAFAFIEGGIFLNLEILNSIIIMPILGYSIYLWSAVLSFSLLGLAIGYKIGGKLSQTLTPLLLFKLSTLLSINLILIIAFYINIIDIKLFSSYKLNILLITFSLCFTPSLILGIFSPILIQLYQNKSKSIGLIFFISTIGGTFFTLISSLYITPYYGILAMLIILFSCSIILIFMSYIISKTIFSLTQNPCK